LHALTFQMEKKKPEIDIVNEVLESCIIAYPVSSFIISLYKQYQQRGSLSKKQLQGLHSKASGIENLSPGKLATLEALINRMPNRFKSEKPAITPMFTRDEDAGKMIEEILIRYPQHKRVLYLKSKFENDEMLSMPEVGELRKFRKLC